MLSISPKTNERLRIAASKIPGTNSRYTDTHQFAVDYEDRNGRYTDEELLSFRTLVTGDENSLAVGVRNLNDVTVIFHNIDLADDGKAMIVQPELPKLVSEHGAGMLSAFIAGNIKVGRPVLRALTEYEGNALIEDIEEIVIFSRSNPVF